MSAWTWLRARFQNGHRRRLAAYLALALAFGAIAWKQKDQNDQLRVVVAEQAVQRERDRAQDIENTYQGCLSTNASRDARRRDRAFFANPNPVPPEYIPFIDQDPAFEVALRSQQARTADYLADTSADHTLDRIDCEQRRNDLIRTGTTTTTKPGG